MFLTSRLIAFTTRRSAARFEAATHDPGRVQRERLIEMVRRNADTEYGRRHGFADIHDVRRWVQRVPVVNYEDIRKDMDRVVRGAKGVFTSEDPVMFAQTSGTTGSPKYVPVTPTCRGGAHSDVMRTWMYHAQRAHPAIWTRKIVSLVSPAVEGITVSGIPYGSTSGSMYKNMSPLVRRAYSIPYPAFEIKDYEAKYFAIMRVALQDDVRFLATANPSSILKMVEKAEQHQEAIIKDIRDGTLSKAFDIEPEIRAAIEKRLKPDPDRARDLEAARKVRGGRLLPGDYWPRLALIGCWKGGTVGHYLEKFPELFDPDGERPVPVRDWGYLSSEARGSIPLSDEGSRGVLAIASNFYEFVKVEDLESRPDEKDKWTFLTAEELEDGGEYYVFFTTTGGLYRYDINDVIKVEGRYNATPQVVFLRKGRGMTNITGEKLSVNQVIAAFQKASESTGVVLSHFKAEADEKKGRYVFRAELGGSVAPETQQAFLRAIDEHLKSINIEYKAKRDSQRLGAPVLHVMREGWYERSRRRLAASGKRVFQAKTEILGPLREEEQGHDGDIETVVEC